jgi:hypothetical protein
MIYTLLNVGVVHGKMNEYTEFVGKELIPIYQRLGLKMVGSWRTTMGGHTDEAVVLFAWENTAARAADKDWQKVYPRYQTLTTGNTTRLLQPNAYSTLK